MTDHLTNSLSRRTALRYGAATAVLGIVGPRLLKAATVADAAGGGADLRPQAPVPYLLAVMQRYPLVAIGELHQLQEEHDLFTMLLTHPRLPEHIDDIVVEFGNAWYQDLADCFVLQGEPVRNTDLAQIWRTAIGGITVWDAPIYEQFFRTVRAVNWMRPPAQRIRVLLGDPPADLTRLPSGAAASQVAPTIVHLAQQRDAHYAGVVEREVLSKGRRALLIAGTNHFLREGQNSAAARTPNTGTLLTGQHPGALFVVDILVAQPNIPPSAAAGGVRLQATLAHWTRPAVAPLAGTWLGALARPANVFKGTPIGTTEVAPRYDYQADAFLYLGPAAVLTASRADPTIYQYGPYRSWLGRISALATQVLGQPVDYVAQGLQQALLPPSIFAGLQG